MTDPWTKWQKHYEALGVVDYVLKEPHGWPGADMRDQLRKGAQYQVWHVLGRWAAGILNGFPPYSEVDTLAEKNRALKSIAGINLKKESGGARADSSVVNAYAFRDRDLIRDQIAEIQPEIVVACSTMDPLIWLLDLDFDDVATITRRPLWNSTRSICVVPWRHPARGGGVKYYQQLKERLAEVL